MRKNRILWTVVLCGVFAAGAYALPMVECRKSGITMASMEMEKSRMETEKSRMETEESRVTVGEALQVFGKLEKALNADMSLRFRVSAADDAPLTRALLAQLVYNAEMAFVNAVPSYEDLSAMVDRIGDCMPKLAATSALSDVDYMHPNDVAIHYALANGFLVPENEAAFGADASVNAREFNEVVRRMTECTAKSQDGIAEKLRLLLAENRSELSNLSAVNLYKKASCALVHPNFPKAEKADIRALLDEIKTSARRSATVTDVVGSKADPNTYVYKLDNDLHFTEVTVESHKPDADPVEIALFADTHFNYFNAQDDAEKNPSLMSTKEYRKWLANGASVPCVNRLVAFARYSDQTVVAGDVLDFLSRGAQQLTVENLFRKDVSMLACLGGHDVTRVMQGKVPDPTPLEARRKLLADFWINDITYDSRVIKDKVMVVVMDNGMGQFYTSQIAKLKADIERARANDWIILIAVHEPLCTRNPANKDTQPFLKGDPDIDTNFFDHKCCRPGHKEASDAVYNLIVHNADVVRGVFNGHEHSLYYTWFNGTYTDESGKTVEKTIPQHTVTCCIYRSGNMCIVTVK